MPSGPEGLSQAWAWIGHDRWLELHTPQGECAQVAVRFIRSCDTYRP